MMQKIKRIIPLSLFLLAQLSCFQSFLFGQSLERYGQRAQKGDKEAQYKLGLCYLSGKDITKDESQGLYWLTKSADQGYSDAQQALGNHYLFKKEDYQKAQEWLLKAAAQNNAYAFYDLGYMYSYGLGVTQDDEKTIFYITKAALYECREAKEIVDAIDINPQPKKGSNGKWGFLTNSGDIWIDYQYDAATPFERKAEDGLSIFFGDENIKLLFSAVKKNGKWGVIDKGNNVFIPFDYEALDLKFLDNYQLVFAVKNGKHGIINSDNRIVVPFEYEEVVKLDNGAYRIKKNGKYGLLNKSFKMTVPCQYEDLTTLANGEIKAKKNGKWGVYSLFISELIIPIEYEDITGFFTTPDRIIRYAVKRNGKWGFVDDKNRVLIPFEYDKVLSGFDTDGKAQVVKNGKNGKVDKNNHFTETK